MDRVYLSYNGKIYKEEAKIFDRCYNIKSLIESFEKTSEDNPIDVGNYPFFTKSEKEEEIVGETVNGEEILESILEYLRHISTIKDLPLYYGEDGTKKHSDVVGPSNGIYLKEPHCDMSDYDFGFVNSKSMYFVWKLMIATDILGCFELSDVCAVRISSCFHHYTDDDVDEWEENMLNVDNHWKLMGDIKSCKEKVG